MHDRLIDFGPLEKGVTMNDPENTSGFQGPNDGSQQVAKDDLAEMLKASQLQPVNEIVINSNGSAAE